MKIYFAGSIRAGRGDQELYHQLIQGLQRYGQVLTEHVGDSSLTELGDRGSSDQGIYARDMGWLAEADLMVAEVSTPSLGVGYELGLAESPYMRTNTFNLASAPAISVPCGFSSQGLPIGLQIGIRSGGEETVLKVAHAYEQSTPWHDMRPPNL